MFVLLFLLCPGANPLNLSAKTRYSPILPHSHPGWHAWNAAARAQHRSPASPAGWHAHTFAYPEIITLIDFAIAHNCAPALTGIISRLRTRLRTPISSVAKYSLRVSIAPKKIIKAQWSSVGTVSHRPQQFSVITSLQPARIEIVRTYRTNALPLRFNYLFWSNGDAQ